MKKYLSILFVLLITACGGDNDNDVIDEPENFKVKVEVEYQTSNIELFTGGITTWIQPEYHKVVYSKDEFKTSVKDGLNLVLGNDLSRTKFSYTMYMEELNIAIHDVVNVKDGYDEDDVLEKEYFKTVVKVYVNDKLKSTKTFSLGEVEDKFLIL